MRKLKPRSSEFVQIFDLGNKFLATAVHRCESKDEAGMGNSDRNGEADKFEFIASQTQKRNVNERSGTADHPKSRFNSVSSSGFAGSAP